MSMVNPSHGKYEHGKSCEAYHVKCEFWYKRASPALNRFTEFSDINKKVIKLTLPFRDRICKPILLYK